MAAPLTWRNVELQNFGSTLEAMSDANEGFQRAFDNLGQVFVDNTGRARTKATNEALAGVLLANDLAALGDVRTGLQGQVGGSGNPLVDIAKVAQAANAQETLLRTNRQDDETWANQQALLDPSAAVFDQMVLDAQRTGEVGDLSGINQRLKNQRFSELVGAQGTGQTYAAGRDDENFDREMGRAELQLKRNADARAAAAAKRDAENSTLARRGAEFSRNLVESLYAKNPGADPAAIKAAASLEMRRQNVDPLLADSALKFIDNDIASWSDPNLDRFLNTDAGTLPDFGESVGSIPENAAGEVTLSAETLRAAPSGLLNNWEQQLIREADVGKTKAMQTNAIGRIATDALDQEKRSMSPQQAWNAHGYEGSVPQELMRYMGQDEITPYEVVALAASGPGLYPDAWIQKVDNAVVDRMVREYREQKGEQAKEYEREIARIDRDLSKTQRTLEAERQRRRYNASK